MFQNECACIGVRLILRIWSLACAKGIAPGGMNIWQT